MEGRYKIAKTAIDGKDQQAHQKQGSTKGLVLVMSALWIEAAKKRLAELWPTNSASEIAAIFGKSRNAIIGQAHRMRLPHKKPTGGSLSKRLKPEPMFRPKPELPPEKPAVLSLPRPERSVSILEATYQHCRAVIDPKGSPEGLAIFCGEPVEEGKFYKFCPYHMKRYTVPPRDRGGFYIRKWGIR